MNRIDCFDLETTDLKGTFGHVLVGCFLPLHKKEVRIFRLDDKKYKPKKRLHDDSKLVGAIKEYMEESFAWVGWYSKMFDVPFLNTRLLLQKQKPINKRMHVDLIYYARKPNLALHSSRLDSVAKSFKLEDQKTVLDPEVWRAAYELDKEAMDYVVEHCTTPEYRTLTRDLRWKPCGDLDVGDELIAFDELCTGVSGRKYRSSVVEAVSFVRAPVFAVELSSGEVIRTTRDHLWLSGANFRRGWRWIKTENLRDRKAGRFATKVLRVIPLFEKENSWKAGWLGGIFDGEGTIGFRHSLSVAQRPGLVLQKAKDIIAKYTALEPSLRWVNRKNRAGLGRGDTITLHVRGSLPARLAFLGTVRPERLIERMEPDLFGRMERRNFEQYEVIKVVPDGEQEIVRVQTSSRTLFVEGYPMHNCVQDVKVLQEAWDVLSPFIRNMHF